MSTGPVPHRERRGLIVGTGLIGTSIALALDEAGWSLGLEDVDPAAMRVARARLAGPAADSGFQLVVVTVPPEQVVPVVRRCLDEHPAATVTDVSSVKGTILDDLSTHPAADRFMAGHPMAGSHLRGPQHASADLFRGRSWAVVGHGPESTVLDVLGLVDVCGAEPVLVDASTHDRAVARVSHLPHLVSGVLAEHLAGSPEVYQSLIGKGALDMTRIAQGDADLWKQIFRTNAHAIRAEVETLIESLQRLVDPVAEGSLSGELESTMSSARSLHRQREAHRGPVLSTTRDQPGLRT